MKKIIPIIVIALLAMVCCHRTKVVDDKSSQQKAEFTDPKEKEALEKWGELEESFNKASLSDKDSILMEMFHAKFFWQHSKYLEPKFDSLIWAFLHDERTFYHEFKSESPDWFVATSQDGKVKMYSYERYGGTAKDGRTIYQYIDKSGNLRVKEVMFKQPEHGNILRPLFRFIKRTKDGYILYGGTQINTQEYYKTKKFLHDTCFVGGLKENESFTIVYCQPVNGYKVKAVVRMLYDINYADITFTKNGKSFTLNTTSFGDSLFNKGGWGMDGTNEDIMKKYHNKTIEADYHATKVDWKYEPNETPFFFKDMDFDAVDELVIVHYRVAVRNHDGYDVYRIVDGEPFLIDYPPYKTDDNFGMTDYPEFDYKKKTIECPYPEGELKWAGRTIYGVSKKQKDTVAVNGRKHLFNHIEKIQEIEFD